MIAAFEHGVELESRGQPPAGPNWVVTVLLAPEKYGTGLVTRLIDELERLALASSSDNVRHAAVSWIASAGDTGSLGTGLARADVVDRLERIYDRTSSPVVHMAIVGRMACQANGPAAARFLERVARSEKPRRINSEFGEPYLALHELTWMGDTGRIILAELHRSGSVRDLMARNYLEQLARNGFRRPDVRR
jgi:hypothetical protein